MYSVRDLAKAIVKGDSDTAHEAYNSIMKEKLRERVDFARKVVSRKMVGQDTIEEELKEKQSEPKADGKEKPKKVFGKDKGKPVAKVKGKKPMPKNKAC